MSGHSMCLAIAGLLLSASACSPGRHSPAGFKLASDGDIQRGKIAFVALECNKCHSVAGVNLPSPTLVPPAPVLGGDIPSPYTDGYLVASIVNPSDVLAEYVKDQTARRGAKSRMPEYADNITVRQLTDVVAFLQSRYIVRQVRYTDTMGN